MHPLCLPWECSLTQIHIRVIWILDAVCVCVLCVCVVCVCVWVCVRNFYLRHFPKWERLCFHPSTLSVCLWTALLRKTTEWTRMKFGVCLWYAVRKKRLNFGGDPDQDLDFVAGFFFQGSILKYILTMFLVPFFFFNWFCTCTSDSRADGGSLHLYWMLFSWVFFHLVYCLLVFWEFLPPPFFKSRGNTPNCYTYLKRR